MVSRSRPVLGVDFHVWDGIFQGSRSHLLGLYRAAIVQAPEIDFTFFLNDLDGLRAAYPEFSAPNVRLVRMRQRPAMWRLAVQLPWLRWRHGVDLLHMQYRLPPMPLGPCACTIHDLLFETHPQFFTPRFVWQAKLTFRDAARRAAVLFSVSQFSRAEIVRLYGVPADHVHVTVNGVDRLRFHPAPGGEAAVQALGLEPGRYVLTVGRLEPRKNHLALLEAYSLLGADAPPLVLIGQRDFGFEGVFDAIDRLALGARVRVLDKVDDQALPAVMRHAALFVYPAHAEGFGMPVAEAMASGVPVVTANTTSLPEVAGPGALTVSPGDVQALAQAMRRGLTEPALRQSLVAAADVHVGQFNWAASAQVLLGAIRPILHSKAAIT